MLRRTNTLSYCGQGSALSPIQRLLYAVMLAGVKELDVEYFKGGVFDYHCEILHLDSDTLRQYILKKMESR